MFRKILFLSALSMTLWVVAAGCCKDELIRINGIADIRVIDLRAQGTRVIETIRHEFGLRIRPSLAITQANLGLPGTAYAKCESATLNPVLADQIELMCSEDLILNGYKKERLTNLLTVPGIVVNVDPKFGYIKIDFPPNLIRESTFPNGEIIFQVLIPTEEGIVYKEAKNVQVNME